MLCVGNFNDGNENKLYSMRIYVYNFATHLIYGHNLFNEEPTFCYVCALFHENIRFIHFVRRQTDLIQFSLRRDK